MHPFQGVVAFGGGVECQAVVHVPFCGGCDTFGHATVTEHQPYVYGYSVVGLGRIRVVSVHAYVYVYAVAFAQSGSFGLLYVTVGGVYCVNTVVALVPCEREVSFAGGVRGCVYPVRGIRLLCLPGPFKKPCVVYSIGEIVDEVPLSVEPYLGPAVVAVMF